MSSNINGIKLNISNLSLPHVIYEVSVLTMAVKTKTIMAYNIGHLHLFILRNTVAQENFVKVFCRLFFHIIQCFISFLCVRQEVVYPPPFSNDQIAKSHMIIFILVCSKGR